MNEHHAVLLDELIASLPHLRLILLTATDNDDPQAWLAGKSVNAV